MHTSDNWRTQLGSILSDPSQRQALATRIGVNVVTLMRWVNGESSPRFQNLRSLLDALPEHHTTLLPLVIEAFPYFSHDLTTPGAPALELSIPSSFYVLVLHTKAYLPKQLLFPSLSQLIVQQALEQLDPHRAGVLISVATCIPSSQGQVRSLLEHVGRGTFPAADSLKPCFFGIESLVGSAVISNHIQVIQQLKDSHTFVHGSQAPWEESVATAPILHLGGTAGCLLVSSTQRDYFLPERLRLVEQYAELLSLAFSWEQFYRAEQMHLQVMPSPKQQWPSLAQFRQRVSRLMTRAASEHRSLTVLEAEQEVWQDLEEALIQVVVQSGVVHEDVY
jgi:transcriptional regulator with XRE-family HTH domain